MSTNSRISLQRRLAIIIIMSAAMAGAVAASAGATPSAGFCQASVLIAVSAPNTQGSAATVRTPRWGGGSVSCVGNLGSWMMGGQGGWSSISGSLHIGSDPFDPAAPVGYTSGRLRLWAQAPRYAWFHASLVTFTSSLRIRSVPGAFIVTGSGRLIPTFKSPAHGSFTLTGVAKLVKQTARGQSNRPRPERLQLQFTVRNK